MVGVSVGADGRAGRRGCRSASGPSGTCGSWPCSSARRWRRCRSGTGQRLRAVQREPDACGRRPAGRSRRRGKIWPVVQVTWLMKMSRVRGVRSAAIRSTLPGARAEVRLERPDRRCPPCCILWSSGMTSAGCSCVEVMTSSPGVKREAVQDDVDPLGGRADERDLVGASTPARAATRTCPGCAPSRPRCGPRSASASSRSISP